MENLGTEKIVDLIARGVGVIDPRKEKEAADEEEATEKEEEIFPFDALPEWLQSVINECSMSYGTPKEVWACAFLSGISAAAGKRFKLLNRNYTNYPQLWLMVVGASGTGKSDPFRIAFQPLKQYDKEAYTKFRGELKEWETTKDGAKPRWGQLLVNDTTPEALYSILQYSDNGLTLYRDELSGFFDDIGRYNKSGEISHYLSIFSNDTFSVNRKNDDPILITKPFLNIVGTVQPTVLQGIFQKNNAETSGFMQRFLFLFPEFPEREYSQKPLHPDTLQSYNLLIQNILSINETVETRLSGDAEKLYADYFSECEKNRTKSDDFWASVYSKAEIQVLRLALLVKIARLQESPTNEVEMDDVECAIGITEFCINSLRKFKEKFPTKSFSKTELIKGIFDILPETNQSEVARLFGVSQPYINKLIKKRKVIEL